MQHLLLIAIISLATSSCSYRSSEALLEKYPESKAIDQSYDCRARASIKITMNDEDFSALTRIKFKYRAKDSSLDLRIVNPLGLTEAVVEIDPTSRHITRAKRKHPLSQTPQINALLSEDWWSELGFIFDLVDKQAVRHSFTDLSGTARRYEKLTRRIECSNTNEEPMMTSRRCVLEEDKLEASINLTFFACEKSLS